MTETIRYEDAAEHVTVEGWACKSCRRWWADDEHMARWCCSTDQPCECGGRKEKRYTVCSTCRERKAEERWAARERRPWNGEFPLYDEGADRFVFDEDDLADLVDESGGSLRLLYCNPVCAQEIDAEVWCNELPDGWELDEVPWLAAAVKQLNAEIRAHQIAGDAVSWRPGEVVAVLPADGAAAKGD